MEEKFLHTINKFNLIKKGDSIVVGVSGGPDSICLLKLLNDFKKKLDIKIYVSHINHMIRKEADEETEYVMNFCKKIGIECFVKKINIIDFAKKNKIGTEEAGRKARYEFFEEVMNKTNSNKIATAHNLNDNVETVLMNLIRGTGTSGLKGIEPIRNGKYIRPIIECERKDIEKYCEINKLEPRFDETNNENIYTRNKIRNSLIPYIKEEFNPNIVSSINRLSEIAKAENEYIEKNAANIFEGLVIEEQTDILENLVMKSKSEIQENSVMKNKLEKFECLEIEEKGVENKKIVVLDLKGFNKQNIVIKSRIILIAIQKIVNSTQGIEKINIDDIIKLCGKNIGNKYLTPNKSIKILVNSGKIYFIKIT